MSSLGPQSDRSGPHIDVDGEFEHVREELHGKLSIALAAHEANSPWGLIQDVESDESRFTPPSPSLMSDAELELLLAAEIVNSEDSFISDNSNDLDMLMLSRPQSALSSASGDSNGSLSSGSSTPLTMSPLSRHGGSDSQDSMSPSDCENSPMSPCHSPCFSRPGSPWPMYARPSFKKTRSPFWTTFRVREFR